MASTEEVLKALQNAKIATLAAPEPEELVIDAESRTITVPSSERLFGVTGDMNIERKYFRCPKIVGDNVDLSTHQIFIAYVYTETESGSIFPSIGVAPYHCEDVEVDGEDITFSWKLTGNVFKNPGFILFKMYAKRTETDPNTVFNTTPAIGTVLATIPDGTEEIKEEYPDVIVQIFDRLDALESGGGGGTGGTTNYEKLSNKPKLNGVTLEGNKTLDQVGVLAKNQGSNNSGKFLSVGSDGNVVPADAPSGGTVDPEQIEQAVNGYLEENPVSGMTAEQEQQLNQNTQDVTDLKNNLSDKLDLSLRYINDGGKISATSMISFIDDDCRVETYNLLFKQVIEPLTVPYTVSCPPEALNDLEGQYMTTSQLLEMYSAGVSVSSHHLKQYNMDQFGSSEEYNSDLVSCTQKFKNMGIKDVVSVAYPQGIVVNDYVNTVKKHYQMGFTINRGINQIPYESYFMKRCEVFPTNEMYTLDDAKALVDQVASEGGWLIFMTHAWYDTFDVDNLKELVTYIRDTGVDIIDINSAIKSTGNIIDIGKFQKPLTDVSTPFFVVDKTGAIWTNTINLVKRSEVTADIINVGYHVGYYLTVNGNTMQHSDTLRTISDPVTASAGEVYRLTCSAVYTNALYVIYDSNGEVLEAKQPDSNVAEAINGDTVLTDYEVTMPEGTAYFRVSSNRNIQPEGYVIKKIEPVQDDTGEGGILGGSADIPRQEMQNTDTNVTLEPNKLYVFPEMASLTVTLAEPDNSNVANEYHFFFTSGATATTLTLNDVLSDAYSIEANMKYEVSILEGVAYIKGVSTSET